MENETEQESITNADILTTRGLETIEQLTGHDPVGYDTRTEAVFREIIYPLQSQPDSKSYPYAVWDVEAIADLAIARVGKYYYCIVTPDEFWEIVARHEL